MQGFRCCPFGKRDPDPASKRLGESRQSMGTFGATRVVTNGGRDRPVPVMLDYPRPVGQAQGTAPSAPTMLRIGSTTTGAVGKAHH